MALTDVTTDAVIGLGRLVLDFGRVNRATFHPDGTTPESDTDHTVMLGVIGCAIASKWFPGLRKGLVAQFALVHDLVEVYAGDTPTLRGLDGDGRAAKKQKEEAAAARIHREFGGEFSWLTLLIAAYEDQTTPEARFVKMLDKLLPKITHLLNDVATVKTQGMSYEALVARYEDQGRELSRYAAEFPELEVMRRELVGRVCSLAAGAAVPG